MPRSMTGFGRSSFLDQGKEIIIELQSLNRKFLEISTYLPKELSFIEMDLRKKISENLSRGFVNVRINVFVDEKHAEELVPDLTLLKKLKNKYEKLIKDLKLEKDSISLAFLMDHLPTFALKTKLCEKKKFLLHLDKAIKDLLLMKKTEGNTIVLDLKKQLDLIKKELKKIEKLAPKQSKQFEEKISKKIKESFSQEVDNQERILREVVLYAEKVDITEEIVRLSSHIEQFTNLLKVDKSVGRKMEFLAQEMQREIHTMGAKSTFIEIANSVVEMKCLLEKIKEQIQNIE